MEGMRLKKKGGREERGSEEGEKIVSSFLDILSVSFLLRHPIQI